MDITCTKRNLTCTLFGDSKRPITCEDGDEKRWCVVTIDVLELIFRRLNYRDLGRAKLVCSHWLFVSKYVENLHVPLLMVPDENNLRLLNLEEKEIINMKKKVGFYFWGDSSYVVGSSHGCLIYLEEDLAPVVLNPWTGYRIQLPHLLSDDYIVVKNTNGDYIGKKYLRTHTDIMPQHWLRAHIVHKVILSSNPFNGGKKFSVALIYGPDSELAYFNMEDYSWTCLDQEKNHYNDIIFHENKLYAGRGWTNHVEVWDFRGIHPKKLIELNLSNPTRSCKDDYYDYVGHSDGWKYYLVESRGKILLIARQVADNVDENGNEVIHPDSVPNETNHPLVFPYGTIAFFVYELEMSKKQWKEVKSLDGCTLFLGGNHSLSITARQDFVKCSENSIYFTDDNWERMEEDNTYGGHDMGVFDMSVGKVRMFDEFSRDRIQPSPCWIVPQLR